MAKAPLIAILTDFGLSDPFVGIMKGVIAGIFPGLPTVDLTQEIPAGDILHGAVALWQSAPYFPDGSVFLCVVDPGVGTTRRPLLLQTGLGQKSFRFIGPDNGLFSFVLPDHYQAGAYQAWELANPALALPQASKTFHGRDIFAPAAAHAALGLDGPEFGPAISDPVRLPAPRLEQITPQELAGQVLYADHFGNLLTSLGRFQRLESGSLLFTPWLTSAAEAVEMQPASLRLSLPGGQRLKLVHTFSEISPGECAGIIGSSGLLEIAANGLSAADMLRLERGSQLTLTGSPVLNGNDSQIWGV